MNKSTNRPLARAGDVSPAIAQKILESMQPPGRRDLARAVSGPSWIMFASALDKAIVNNPALERTLEEVAARRARTALAVRDLPVPSIDEFLTSLRTRISVCGGTFVRAFWWGFHIEISHDDLTASDPVSGLADGRHSPASAFLPSAASFIASALDALRRLDQGDGVYISMSWFAPFIFVPTSV
jgi:hypothetical protein